MCNSIRISRRRNIRIDIPKSIKEGEARGYFKFNKSVNLILSLFPKLDFYKVSSLLKINNFS